MMHIKLNDTVKLMNGEDFKDRMRAEFYQLVIRADGLEAMLKKYKAGELPFVPKCSYDLLHEQLVCMRQYQRVLERRAEIEDVSM